MDEERNKIDNLENRLNSRNYNPSSIGARSSIKRETPEVRSSWRDEDDVKRLLQGEIARREARQGGLFKKIFFGSIVFFILALVISLSVFFLGGNFVSSNNIDIQVLGPTTISGGQELSLDVIVKNGNRTDLDSVMLTIEYPTGTRKLGDINTPLVRERESLGKISSHGEGRKTFKSVIFGEKDSVQNIKVSIEYRISGSSATFSKEKDYEIGIGNSPIILSAKYPEEVNSGQIFDIDIEAVSNSPETLRDVLFSVEYPFGFTFTNSSLKPISDNNVWRIGDLPSGEKRSLKIQGSIEGQNEEERTFRFRAGISNGENKDSIGADFAILSQSIHIMRPFVGIDLTFDGAGVGDPVVAPGTKSKANIVWTNNLSGKLLNMKIEAKLSGLALDRGSVLPSQGGFFRSVDNTIIWDKSTNPEFVSVSPGDKGVVGFNFSPLQNIPSGLKNQQINISVTISGDQLMSGSPQAISSKLEKNVKLSSGTGFSSRSVRSIGPFENMGPIPPRADTETTYTILWDLTNSLNDMQGARVEGTLPSYVTWSGLTSPKTESMTFDPVTRKVVWNVGSLSSGTGFSSPARSAAFQVSVLPSLGQVGSAIDIVTGVSFGATDSFTKNPISILRDSVTTKMIGDPTYHEGDDVVKK